MNKLETAPLTTENKVLMSFSLFQKRTLEQLKTVGPACKCSHDEIDDAVGDLRDSGRLLARDGGIYEITDSGMAYLRFLDNELLDARNDPITKTMTDVVATQPNSAFIDLLPDAPASF